MIEQKPNMICKYSKCHKEYYACSSCHKFGHYKTCGCCIEHFAMYQNEVYFHRGDEMPFPELLEQMVQDGALPESVLTK